ncbi:MAG: FecR domain-containing protein, partial [Bacteroidetes bacterium]|nr:FecR domain-containing protein [Bacteroidota bacterium]
RRLIEEWLQLDRSREQYYQWLVDWEHRSPQYLPDAEATLFDYIHYMQEHPVEPSSDPMVPVEKPGRAATSGRRNWLLAASLFLSVGLLGWLGKSQLLYKTYQTGYNETRSLQLEDGTQVAMNANSSLRVPRFGFGSTTREVFLAGEANFAVTHTVDNQRFVVRGENDLEIVVLGTEFTVNSRPRGSKVVLNKGKVKLRFLEGEAKREVTMQPGDLVTVDPGGKARVRKTASPQNYAAWAAHRFVFEGTNLRELSYLFEDNYGLKIKIEEEELQQLTLYGSFQAQSAEELLKALTDAANLRYTQSNDTITITYKE